LVGVTDNDRSMAEGWQETATESAQESPVAGRTAILLPTPQISLLRIPRGEGRKTVRYCDDIH
jgi:hypothetical protein